MRSVSRSGAWLAIALAALAPIAACRADGAAREGASESIGVSASAIASDEHIAWQRGADGPAGRSAHAMAFDSARGKAVLFGGQAGGDAFGDTWEWDGSSWTRACTDAACAASAPPARFAHAMAYDAKRARTVLFGGQGAALFGDTWEWDGSSWTHACTDAACVSAAPSARQGHSMAFDSARGVIVLFGGQACTTSCVLPSDTSLWNGTRWQRASTAGPSRVGAAMTFHAARGEIVLFGGTSTIPLRDTWAWDSSAWSLRSSGGDGAPAARSQAAIAYDPARASALLFGGSHGLADAWIWSGDAWASLPAFDDGPSARLAHAMVLDDARARFVLFGGFAGGAYANDTWIGHRYGGACLNAGECATGVCEDGVCCTSACGVCEDCDGAPTRGTCAPVTSRKDPDTCAGARACDADGRCLLANGAACTHRADCISTYCVDGVCCNESCDGPCRACRADLTGSASGTCSDVPAATDPRNACPDEGACTCQRDGFCDGHGSCRIYQPDQDCSQCGDPAGSVLRAQCDGRGSCVAKLPVACLDAHRLVTSDGTTTDCAPYACASGECRQTCTSSSQCADGYACTAAGRCAAPPLAPDASPVDIMCNMHASMRGRDAPYGFGGAGMVVLALLACLRRARATSCPSA